MASGRARCRTGCAAARSGFLASARLASLVAEAGRGLGMRVLVWGREASREKARAAGYEVAASQGELFERADVLQLLVRLARDTRGIVTAADLARMKPTALLVNVARAELIEPGALVAALERGRPGLRRGRRLRTGAGHRRRPSAIADAERPLHCHIWDGPNGRRSSCISANASSRSSPSPREARSAWPTRRLPGGRGRGGRPRPGRPPASDYIRSYLTTRRARGVHSPGCTQ